MNIERLIFRILTLLIGMVLLLYSPTFIFGFILTLVSFISLYNCGYWILIPIHKEELK